MKFLKLTNEEAAASGWTHKWIVDFNDLVAAGATTSTGLNLVTSENFPARSKCEAVSYDLITNFKGASVTELTMSVGYHINPSTNVVDAFVAAASLCDDATPVPTALNPGTATDASTVDQTYGTEESTVIASLRTAVNILLKRIARTFTAAWNPTATFTATGANLSVLTQGEVHIFARVTKYGSDAV